MFGKQDAPVDRPSISVIVPTVGRIQLRRSLESVYGQLEADDELILVADGPIRSVRDVVAEFASPRLRYLEHDDPESSFGWAQRNVGMRIASGDVMAFLDDDDTYLPNALASIRREAVHGRPMIFRREYKDRFSWTAPEFIEGEIGTGMFVVPRIEGRWMECPMSLTRVKPGYTDFRWILETLELWPAHSVLWCRDFIYCCKGHGCGGKTSDG